MRLHFVSVPVHGGAAVEDELNQFLATHRVVGVDRHLVPDGARSSWAVCVSYVDPETGAPRGATGAPAAKKKEIDYRAILPPEQFAVYAKLRELRKQIAEREAIPAWAIFTNEQLAAMVTRKIGSTAEIEAIEGVGRARVEKYASRFLAALGAATTSAPRPS